VNPLENKQEKVVKIILQKREIDGTNEILPFSPNAPFQ